MKNAIKISLLLLMFTVSLSYCVVKAYDSPQVVMVIKNGLIKNQWTNMSETYTKTNLTIQSYQNDNTFTSLTNPCPNCKIETILYGINYQTVVTTLGKTAKFTDSLMNEPGDYKIKLRRKDSTLLNTYHYATWHLNG